MESRQKFGFKSITRLLSRLDARVPLPRLGLVAGALGGAGYTFQSASHMILPARSDLYPVSLMLAALGGASGWLTGVMLKAPLSRADRAADGDGGQPGTATATAEPGEAQAAGDRE